MYNLIIVEDEKIVREALAEYITNYCKDFMIRGCFSDGDDALNYIHGHTVDVILTDIKMARMDGLTLCQELSRKYPYCHAIIISGFGTFDYARRALKYGVENYLLKPIDFKELSDCLDKIKNSLDAKAVLLDVTEEDSALFFIDLATGGMKSPKLLNECITRLNLSFLSENSSGYVLRLSLPEKDYIAWRYEKDRLPYAFTNVLRMNLENTYVNNFLSIGSSAYYIVIFKGEKIKLCTENLEESMLDLFHMDSSITEICHFSSLTHLSTQKVLESISLSNLSHQPDDNAVIEKIKEYINQHYYKDISRQELADMFYFSTAYFSRFFKKKVGMNFIDYLTTVRMNQAIELLNSKTSIDGIAKQVGYNSRNHFILNFRQYTTMSPTEYRKQILKL